MGVNIRTFVRAFPDASGIASDFREKEIFFMAKKLYVGNLSYNTTEDGLRGMFSGFGTVASAKIIFDRETGNSKGFGFIEMSTEEEATAAIAGTNGQEFEGRQLRVNEAIDKPRRDRGSGGGYGNNW